MSVNYESDKRCLCLRDITHCELQCGSCSAVNIWRVCGLIWTTNQHDKGKKIEIIFRLETFLIANFLREVFQPGNYHSLTIINKQTNHSILMT